jgi:site-specific DNA recombinase
VNLDGYVRVSRVGGREGDSFISPAVQRDQIAKWASLRGVTIAQWHEDLDQSGGKLTRPGLDALMDRVHTGATGGIAVARLDRLSRAGVADALRLVESIQEAGGTLAIVDLGIDPTTDFGEFAMTIMLALARMQRRQIAGQWKEAQRRAVERGVHVSSHPPTGYLRTGRGSQLIPDPAVAPLIRGVFTRRAGGASWSELAAWLGQHEVEGPFGTLNWRTRVVAQIIANRVYLGEARSGDFVNPNAHEAVVDRQTWEAAQLARGVTPAKSITPAFLSGILRCAGCRHTMKADWMTLRSGERTRTYRCRKHHAGGVCQDSCAVIGRQIDPWVEAQLLEHLGALAVRSHTDDAPLRAATSDVADALADLEAYRDDSRIMGAIGMDAFVAGLEARSGKLDDARASLAAAREAQSPFGRGAANIVQTWPDMDTLERRKVLSATMDAVMLRSGRGIAIEDRARILWRGQGPDDLPRRGIKRVVPIPYLWPVND